MSFDERKLLVKVAQMYYEMGATQSEIAKEMGVSRSLISKYLSKARELGIVEIIIHDEIVHSTLTLEQKIKNQYRLKEVICIPTIGETTTKKRLGTAASKYLLRILRNVKLLVSLPERRFMK